MSEYIWHHELYSSGGEARYAKVIVLAWHEGTATVLPLGLRRVWSSGNANPIGYDEPQAGAVPYLVKTSELRFGQPPEASTVAA